MYSLGLESIFRLAKGESRSINAENPTGAKGAGGQASNHLGQGRKGRAYLPIAPGETLWLADIEGMGILQHIWITVTDQTPGSPFVLRNLVLRMYWDGEETPSVEVPLGDFFCSGFGRRALVNSLPVVVAPIGGMNCFFQMPFRKGARVSITNEHPVTIEHFFYQIDYRLVDDLPEDTLYFHAQWRRENPTQPKRDYTVLEGVRGRGQYIGTYLGIAALERYWWGEGEFKFYIDGDGEFPTICGTGIEDYVGGAWGFIERPIGQPAKTHTYSSPFMGYTTYETQDDTITNPYERPMVPMHGMYRWHLPDPIRFDQDLRVTVQQIGHDGYRLYERADDVCSVAYWYQQEPHAEFPLLPGVESRRPR